MALLTGTAREAAATVILDPRVASYADRAVRVTDGQVAGNRPAAEVR